jgi:cell division protein FtsI/penicillin-binding protein 2
MGLRAAYSQSETQKKRSLLQRMVIVHAFLFLCVLVIVARLMKLQILEQSVYHAAAHRQHYGGVKLPAQRGEILALNSKTGETSILATNTTLDLLYVDPLVVDEPGLIADLLAEVLLTPQIHDACSRGLDTCPRELITIDDSPYTPAFDPLLLVKRFASGTVLEPMPQDLASLPTNLNIPDLTESRRRFARSVQSRISEKRVTFAPLKYSATKPQKEQVRQLHLPGVFVNDEQNLVYADPESVDQSRVAALARTLSPVLEVDAVVLEQMLVARPLRYVPVMRRLTPQLSLAIKQLKVDSLKATNAKRAKATTRQEVEAINDPLRAIALIQEHWRYYPDPTIASHVIGFVNNNQDAQYGVERTFDPLLRGQEGSISTVSDPHGGQILTADQTIIDAKDGDTLVLTIDPFVQKEIERILEEGIQQYQADSGQVIVMDPHTGRIIAMANAPGFERDSYTQVYTKEPIPVPEDKRQQIVVEIFDPRTNERIVKAYIDQVFTPAGRELLPEEIRTKLSDAEKLFDLPDITRYYQYTGEFARRELFPTDVPGIWLKYKNNLGVGAYLNRAVQEIYEPGSVMKSVTMAIALDQGEVVPDDTYLDTGEVKKDEFTIRNAFKRSYGRVSMTTCLELSINTCMTHVADALGKKLFHHALDRFGFGRVSGIELEDELPGALSPWNRWSDAELATKSFGQGISVTPLQMITASAVLANGGKLMHPYIVERLIHSDGTIETTEPKIVDQVIKESTARTITAMLVSSATKGYAVAGKVKGHSLAAKTGTSQIARPGGGYETGSGSTVASFVGYSPAVHPRFIALVKLDRPKKGDQGATAAAPMFKTIANFLYGYYGMPPDEY